MAKRKRLTPAQPGFLGADPGLEAGPDMSMASAGAGAPIAQVTGAAAVQAALSEVSAALADARADGRLMERLPIGEIDERHLVRDRLEQDEDEMGALMDSLRARGQQTPIEVTALPDGGYGLIAGWRRLTALRRLYSETSDPKYATVKALVTTPDTAREAYVAMVEENEIRVNLSLYERARIVLRALDEDVYPTTRAALQGLFGSTTRSRRSKIGSFIALVEALDDTLRHPTAISEKLGLALVREILRDPGFVARLKAALRDDPRDTADSELRLLAAAIAAAGPVDPVRAPDRPPSSAPSGTSSDAPAPAAPAPLRSTPMAGVTLRYSPRGRRIDLTGMGVDETLFHALEDWLAQQGGD